MKKDTLIFDLDGTLLDTLEGLKDGFNYAITKFGYPPRTLDEVRSFVGNGIKVALKLCLPNGVEDKEFEKIVEVFKIYYLEHSEETTKVYDGILEMLKILHDKGYKIAVVSNKYDDAVKELCKVYFNGFIDFAIGEGYGIERKPNPNGVYKAIQVLNSTVESSLYIGDSEVDILTAKNANIPCVSVLWGFREKDFLVNNGAKIFAQNAKELLEIIENFT